MKSETIQNILGIILVLFLVGWIGLTILLFASGNILAGVMTILIGAFILKALGAID